MFPLCKLVGAAGRGYLRNLVDDVFAPRVRANRQLGRCAMGVKPCAARICRLRPGFSLADHQVESQVKLSPVIPAPADVYVYVYVHVHVYVTQAYTEKQRERQRHRISTGVRTAPARECAAGARKLRLSLPAQALRQGS